MNSRSIDSIMIFERHAQVAAVFITIAGLLLIGRITGRGEKKKYETKKTNVSSRPFHGRPYFLEKKRRRKATPAPPSGRFRTTASEFIPGAVFEAPSVAAAFQTPPAAQYSTSPSRPTTTESGVSGVSRSSSAPSRVRPTNVDAFKV